MRLDWTPEELQDYIKPSEVMAMLNSCVHKVTIDCSQEQLKRLTEVDPVQIEADVADASIEWDYEKFYQWLAPKVSIP